MPDEPGVIPYEHPRNLTIPDAYQLPYGPSEYLARSQLSPRGSIPPAASPGSIRNISLAQVSNITCFFFGTGC